MAKHFSAVVLLLIYFGSPALPAREKIPNDPYYKYQFSFHNPGGKIRINTRSNKPSMKEFDAEKGIDLNIEKAWGITTGSKSVVVALLDVEKHRFVYSTSRESRPTAYLVSQTAIRA